MTNYVTSSFRLIHKRHENNNCGVAEHPRCGSQVLLCLMAVASTCGGTFAACTAKVTVQVEPVSGTHRWVPSHMQKYFVQKGKAVAFEGFEKQMLTYTLFANHNCYFP